ESNDFNRLAILEIPKQVRDDITTQPADRRAQGQDAGAMGVGVGHGLRP
ncbi:hypothetical protein LCGC14_2624480, partial [marine sediment metagenome]